MPSKQEYLDFLYNLANGFDPITGEAITDYNDVFKKVDIVRTLFCLRDLIDKNVKNEKTKKIDFKLTDTDVVVNWSVSISSFVRTINDKNYAENMKKAKYKNILDWLIKEEYLFINSSGSKEPTQKGYDIGMSYVERSSTYGRMYFVVEYDSNAQEFILDNILSGNINFS